MKYPSIKKRGITLVEVLVGVSILAIITVSIGITVNSYTDARGRLLSEAKATYLAEEGYEILRAIRDEDWGDISSESIDAVRYLDVTATTLDITGTVEVVDGAYTRSFILRDLYRNADDDIVESTASGAAVDPDSRIVEVSVVGPNGTVSLSSILSNVHNI